MPLRLLAAVVKEWKAFTIILMIFSAGLSVGEIFSKFTQLPARVESLERQHHSIDSVMTSMQFDIKKLRENNAVQLCLQIAERRHSDWQVCVK